MHLRQNEKVLKTYHHHPFPYVIRVLKIVLSSIPFYFLLFLFRKSISTNAFITAAFVITGIFLLALLYDGLLYWLDKLVITNFRVIYENWIFFTINREFEAELTDIQDIETQEKGFLSYFRIFDYGDFIVQTAAARVTLIFDYAPDPEGIKHYVFSIKDKGDDL